jgi:hypothetical protein
LPGLEADGDLVWTYKHALPPHMPKKLLVIGSGAIGIEFASFYNTLGADTTVVEVMDRILPVEDAEISAFAKKSFEKQGMKIMEKAMVKKARPRQGQGHRPYRDRRQGREARLRHRDLRRGHRGQYRRASGWRSWAPRSTAPSWSPTPTAAPGSRGSTPSATPPTARGWRTRPATRASWWPN